MKKILFVVFVLLPCLGYSQKQKSESPNYNKIEKAIKKQKSDLFYSKLMEKYLNADTTMTINEKRHLYYGYTFQDSYSPYGSSPYQDSLKHIFEKEIFSTEDYADIIRFSDSALLFNPFDIRSLLNKSYSYKALENETEDRHCIAKINIIVDAIMSSGRGLEKTNAIYVINVDHEYDIIRFLGLQPKGQSLIGHYDYLTFTDNEYGIEGLYFDISPCLKSLYRIFK